jgi:antitoxin VapB
MLSTHTSHNARKLAPQAYGQTALPTLKIGKARSKPSAQAATALAKIFTTGGSQAVRLPKAFRFSTSIVQVTSNQAGQVILTALEEDPEAKRKAELRALVKMLEATRLADEDDFISPPRELTDFRTPFQKIEGVPPITFAKKRKPCKRKLQRSAKNAP